MDYSLKGHILDKEDYTKYLGVELQSSLSWIRHIDQTVKKAHSMLGFLRRNLRVNTKRTDKNHCILLNGSVSSRKRFICMQPLYP